MLLNKVALSSFSFSSPNALLFFQCAVCVVATRALQRGGVVSLEPVTARLARAWLPANLLFVLMLGTSFWALASLNVAMVTVLKNLTNLFTLAGDYWLHGTRYGAGVHACMALMTLSALCGAATDLTFDARGYAWQLLNCAAAAAYSLVLRRTLDAVAPLTRSGRRMDELSMVYVNNLLSLPLIAAMMLASGEARGVWREPDLRNPAFLAVAGLSGLLGLAISFTSLWFLASTTATIYSLVGSLNKVPLAIIGLFAFRTPWSLPNLASIMVGLAAGAVFGLAKSGGLAPTPRRLQPTPSAAALASKV